MKIIRGGRCWLVAEIYLMKEVYALDLGVFCWICCLPDVPSTRPLVPIPSMMPASSILYLLAGLIAVTVGLASCWNHLVITSDVALFVCWESIRRLRLVLISGCLFRNLVIHVLLSLSFSSLILRMRLANLWICVCVRGRLSASWVVIQVARWPSWTGERRCRPWVASWCGLEPEMRCWRVDLGTP